MCAKDSGSGFGVPSFAQRVWVCLGSAFGSCKQTLYIFCTRVMPRVVVYLKIKFGAIVRDA